MKIILSCTTTCDRLDLFYYCIQSLLNQSLKPDLFLLNLSKESFCRDNNISGGLVIPEWLDREEITINWVEDTMSYRKLLPALDFADDNDLIITVDDDILYSKTLLEELVNASLQKPNAIICGYARKMKKNVFNNWQNYRNWSIITTEAEGLDILPGGGAGTVYRKRLLDLGFLLDQRYLVLAPTTDDLWFKAASLVKNVPVAVFPQIHRKNNFIVHNKGLSQNNLERMRVKSFFGVGFNFIRKRFNNYFGINQTPNDSNWDKIMEFMKNI